MELCETEKGEVSKPRIPLLSEYSPAGLYLYIYIFISVIIK